MPVRPTIYTIRYAADLEAALDHIGSLQERRNDIAAMLHMDVCPMGLFSAFVLEVMRLFNAAQSRPLPWPIYREPAVYARAVDVIQSEVNAISREQKRVQERNASGERAEI